MQKFVKTLAMSQLLSVLINIKYRKFFNFLFIYTLVFSYRRANSKKVLQFFNEGNLAEMQNG